MLPGEIAQIPATSWRSGSNSIHGDNLAFQKFLEENSIPDEFTQLTAAIDNALVTENFSDEVRRIRFWYYPIKSEIDQPWSTGCCRRCRARAIMEALDSHGFRMRFLSVRFLRLQEDTEEATFAGAQRLIYM